jgi:hypothetical protein
MDSLNIGIIAPFLVGLLEAIKTAGVPSKYMKLLNLLISLAVAALIDWRDPLALLTNTATVYLAIEGAFKTVREIPSKKMQNSEEETAL